MQPNVKLALNSALAGEAVSEEVMRSAVGEIMDGACSPAKIAALLTALAMKGEAVSEIAGAASAMRARAAGIPTTRTGLLDTCGTGGDKLHTFNISTATAIVVAAAGAPIAKHGNKSVSSSSGSADVLQALGVNVELSPEQAGRCLDEIGLCFCYARVCHAAMKHVAPIRAELGFRTIFNLLGPLTNPAGAAYQLLGTNSIATAEKLAHAVSRLGTSRTFVVCGNNQLDEVALWGTTTVFDVTASGVEKRIWSASDFGLSECDVGKLRVDSPQASAARIRSILAGESGPARDVVVANAAAALLCSGKERELPQAAERVQQVIDSGAGREMLQRLVDWTGGAASC